MSLTVKSKISQSPKVELTEKGYVSAVALPEKKIIISRGTNKN
jgi:hypothetical protein